jgi:hypothetical protein
MKSRASLTRAVAAVAVGVLIGGGVTTITPAGAEVSQFAATNWKKIWKKKLQPQADKRYYTKAASNAKYAAAGSAYSKAEVDAKLGGYYTKTEADARYQPVGNYAAAGSSYTKAESDAKYAPAPKLIRGTIGMGTTAVAASDTFMDGISFGATLSAPAIPHYIALGDPVPAGCSGSGAAPDASPGHLCVFETYRGGAVASTFICSLAGDCGATSTMGASVGGYASAAGTIQIIANWAVRPVAVVATSFAAKGMPNNVGSPSAGLLAQ